MEKLNYVKNHHGLEDGVGYTFIRAISEFMSEEDARKVFDQAHANDGDVEVELTISGVSVPVIKVLESVWNSFKEVSDENVREAALKLIQGSKLEKLLNVIQQAEWKIEKELAQLGIDHE